jgi:hypothetical protein
MSTRTKPAPAAGNKNDLSSDGTNCIEVALSPKALFDIMLATPKKDRNSIEKK